MHIKIPEKLKKDPLVEALWEIRFTSTKPSVPDLLPGLLFKALPDKYPDIVRLPAADIPDPIAQREPRLRYVPKIRMEGGNQAVQIGKQMVALSCRRPYSGWKKFSADICELVKVVWDTKLIDRLERFSLKYIDLIELERPPDIACLNVGLKLGGHELNKQPVQLRTEIKKDGLIHIIQIISPAEVDFPGGDKRFSGVLLDIDTINPMKEGESWEEVQDRLDAAHSSSKKMFFSLLTAETIEKLGPIYQE